MRPESGWGLAVLGRRPAAARETLDLADADFDLIFDSGETIYPTALTEDRDGANPLLIDRIDAEGVVP